MNEHDYWNHLEAYADGELSAEERAVVEARLHDDSAGRAAVDRWRALRKCARRGVVSIAVPVDLRTRVEERLAASHRSPQRVYSLRYTISAVMAAAALLLLAFAYWGSGRGGQTAPVARTVISAQKMLETYRDCAVVHHHDPYDIEGMTHGDAVTALSRKSACGKSSPIELPDLTDKGFDLAGACDCLHVNGRPVVHAYYWRHNRPAGQLEAKDVVSFFALDESVVMSNCAAACVSGGCHAKHPERSYAVACVKCDKTGKDVHFVKWDDAAQSFAACSALKQDELLTLVDDIEIAQADATGKDFALLRSLQGGALAGWGLVGIALGIVSFSRRAARLP